MLYQTHPLSAFQFHPFTSSTIPHLSPTPSSQSSLLLSQAETEMARLEAALKSSLRKDMSFKLSPQTFPEELSFVTSCDDFFVDELLDFSLLEKEKEKEKEKEESDKHNHHSPSASPHNHQFHYNNFNNPSFKDQDFNSELTLPVEEVADLEWLSNFVEDCFSEHSISFPVTATEKAAPEPGNTGFTFKTPIPGKARSKRTRTGVRVWPLKSPSLTDMSSSCTSSSSSSESSHLLTCATAITSLDGEEKKPKKRAAADGVTTRRCSHCGVQKTPQWRTGPLGAKTLCNACGVRYKSGRLLPEYRPACSPTFSSELHSNHHRKVLEMRQKKVETEPDTGSDSGSVPLVPRF